MEVGTRYAPPDTVWTEKAVEEMVGQAFPVWVGEDQFEAKVLRAVLGRRGRCVYLTLDIHDPGGLLDGVFGDLDGFSIG